jgi:hypothetical protein
MRQAHLSFFTIRVRSSLTHLSWPVDEGSPTLQIALTAHKGESKLQRIGPPWAGALDFSRLFLAAKSLLSGGFRANRTFSLAAPFIRHRRRSPPPIRPDKHHRTRVFRRIHRAHKAIRPIVTFCEFDK